MLTDLIYHKLELMGMTWSKTGEDFILTQCLNPTHDDSHPSFSINIETGSSVCFTCGYRLDSKFWTDGELDEETLEELERNLQYSQLKKKLKADEEETGGALHIPERDKIQGSFRGLTEETVKKFDLYITETGKYADRIIFPFWRKGYIVGYTGRTLGDSKNKYMHNKGFRVKELVYPYDQLKGIVDDTVVVVEGVMDAISLYQDGIPAIVNFGVAVNISDKKVADLLSLGVEKLVLMFDEDKAGKKALEEFKENSLVQENFEVINGRDYKPLKEFYESDCKDYNDFLVFKSSTAKQP